MATIGVTRGLGDHDLKVYNSNIYIKPFLSCVPEVSVRSQRQCLRRLKVESPQHCSFRAFRENSNYCLALSFPYTHVSQSDVIQYGLKIVTLQAQMCKK